MFIPHTLEGTLRSRLNRMEESLNFNTRFKYIEELGRSARELVIKKDPDPEACGRRDCFPCESKPGTCQRGGVVYRVTCGTCETKGENVYYIGESARTLYDRGLEHKKAIENRNEESPMVEHAREKHPESMDNFRIEAICYPTRTLLRQATEANQIQVHRKKGHIINRRGEWGQNLPPKFTADPSEIGKDAKTNKKRKTPSNPPSNLDPMILGA